VALVHGLATTAERTWTVNGWVDLLRDEGRDVVAPDLLGHGSADAPHEPVAYDELEAHLDRDLPEGTLDAVGFSLGARSLLVLATRRPERFRRLVVAGVGANLFRGEDEADPSEELAAALAGEAAMPPWAHYFERQAVASGVDPRALAALLRRPHPAPLDRELLARVQVPVLVVLGTEDFAGPADPLVEALPDATLRLLPGVDHFATPKDMGFLDAALRFLGA
jgi:pimeloyl-ACP methyl ester carboxylesterase